MEEKVSAEVIFQAIVQNNDAVKHMSYLVEQADEFNVRSSQYDIIKEYIKLSGNCQEIIQFIKEIPTADSQKAYLTLRALCHILIRIASDLNVYIAAGTSIVNEVLLNGMRTIFNFLKSGQKTLRTKIALHLIAAMIALGKQSAIQVVAKLDFTNLVFISLLKRSNNSEEEDVRTAFLNVIVLILTLSNDNAIRQMVEAKGFLNYIFPGLKYDTPSIVSLILNAFRVKIIENSHISKTNKVQLFNEHSLSHVTHLYTWKGPQRKDFHKRKFNGDAQPIIIEATEEEVLEVQNSVHQFMLAIISKNGIIFYDDSLGLSGKNINYRIMKVLGSLKNPFFHPLMAEFIISTLKECPDQLRFYLPYLKDSFKPRLSISFANGSKFLIELMKSQDPVALMYNCSIKRTASVLLNISKTFCMIDILKTSDIVEILHNGHHVLCYYLCCVISSTLEQANTILDSSINNKSSEVLCDTSDLLVFQQSFLSLVLEQFPVLKGLENYWNKITLDESKESDEICTVNNVPIPSLSEEILMLVNLFKLLQSLYLKSGKDFDVNLPQMLLNVKKDNVLSSEDLKKVYISIVDLMSSQNALEMWNKGVTNTSLKVVVEIYQAAHRSGNLMEAKDIVYKVLLHTKVFDGCRWEIDVWLESLEHSKSRHIPYIFDFMNEVLLALFKNPKKFLVKDMQSLSSNATTGSSKSNLEGDIPIKQCFSRFVLAALFNLQNFDKKGCQLFVERSLILIMHCQHSPLAFFENIKTYKNVISPSLLSYFEILSVPKKATVDKIQSVAENAPCPLDLSGHLKRNFMANHSSDSSVEICSCNLKDLLKEQDVNSIQKIIWQLLMYMDFELTLVLDEKNGERNENFSALNNYLMLLQQLLYFLTKNSAKKADTSNETNSSDTPQKDAVNEATDNSFMLQIMKETLIHPIMLKLFLCDKFSISLKNNVATKLVLSLTLTLLNANDTSYHDCLLPFKDKIVALLQSKEIFSFSDGVDFESVLEHFSILFSPKNIADVLEGMLSDNTDDQILSSIYLLLKLFLEKESEILLSPTCFSSLVAMYFNALKKSKKSLRSLILQLLDRNPKYALMIDNEIAQLLVQKMSIKDLTIMGKLMDFSENFRQVVQRTIDDIDAEHNCTVFIYLASKCILKCQEESDTDKNFKQLITSKYWRALSECLLNDEDIYDYDLLKECNAGKAAGQLLYEKSSVPKKLNSFCKTLLERDISNPSIICVILQLLQSWKLYEPDVNKTLVLILQVTCFWLQSILTEEFSCCELINLIKEILQKSTDLEIPEILDTSSFFTKCLKVSFKNINIGKEVLQVLTLLCEKSKGGTMPIKSIYDLVTGHSSFFQFMLSEKREENAFKESLIDFLIILTKLDPDVCKENHIGLFLSAYGATMANVDQKLLFLMKLYSDNDVNMVTYSPFLWGKPAIGHYSVMSNTQQYLWKQPKLQDVLSLFVPEMIESTILNFPLNITLQPAMQCLAAEETLKHKIYDLRFILHLFANLLAPGCFVNCRKFVESKVLMMIFGSLSCTDSDVRALGYFCLSQFYGQLESANFREKDIWLCLLDSVRNSISSVNPKLPCIITLFLAKVVDIFIKPDHPMYLVICKFLTLKPNLDITQVPEYFKLFNSLELEHRIQKLWLLNLIGDGLRTSVDFHICEKRYIFFMLQHYYFSSLASKEEKLAILHILCSAVKIQSTSRTLCERGLLLWIQAASKETEVEITRSLIKLMGNLEITIVEKFTFQYKSINMSLQEKMKIGR